MGEVLILGRARTVWQLSPIFDFGPVSCAQVYRPVPAGGADFAGLKIWGMPTEGCLRHSQSSFQPDVLMNFHSGQIMLSGAGLIGPGKSGRS
jgi:hypothetical protein